MTSDLRTGLYGQDYAHGVLVDHVPVDALVVFVKGDAFVKTGTTRTPILCGDLVEIATEDGPMSGRCGHPVGKGEGELAQSFDFGCPGHAGQRRRWLASSEAERLDWERRQELV